MTAPVQRRSAAAELAAVLLDVVPGPDQPPVFTGWLLRRAGVEVDTATLAAARRALDRLARRGLVERVHGYGPPTVYWRLTAAGAAWSGTVDDLARPIPRHP